MATAYKVLGQAAPAATTDTNVYTVPAATEAVISTIVFANRAATDETFRLAIRPNGDTISSEHYLAYDVALAANDSTTLTLGITMDAADIITVQCSSSDMSVSIFGSEIS